MSLLTEIQAGWLAEESVAVPGVFWTNHKMNHDLRGSFTEAAVDHVVQKLSGHHIRQVNVSISNQNVLRGMHWHRKQLDAWYIAEGMAQVCVQDIDTLLYEGRVLTPGHGVVIPPRTAHGFLALTTMVLVYSVSEAYDRQSPDEQGYDPFGSSLPWMIEKDRATMSKRDTY